MKKIYLGIFIGLVILLLIPSRSVNAKSFTIVHSNFASWSASYKINVAKGKIKSASNVRVSARIGKITSKKLKVNSTKRATLYITRKVANVYYHAELQVNLVKGKPRIRVI
ncbi:DUF5626 family protein [Pediococcus siamensis]|uniref:DUF5626 family protein n=1 Tax=Pediococcus siamensis TaxID=381829 RepID=UPI0039A06093